MRPGQDVVIKVDALGGRKFHGKVTQIGGATGSRLSPLPAGERYRQLRQSRPAHSRPHRLHSRACKQENSDSLCGPACLVTPDVEVK